MVGIVTLQDRSEALAASFVDHWQRRREDHPINDVLRLLGTGPWPRRLLLPRLGTSTLRQSLLVGFDDDVTMRERLRYWTWQRYISYATAGRDVSLRSRARKYGTDKTVYWKDKETRQLALSWRVGSFGFQRRCPTLTHRLNKGCCNLEAIRDYPNLDFDHEEPIYNGIDHVLNQQCPKSALRILKNLDEYLRNIGR